MASRVGIDLVSVESVKGAVRDHAERHLESGHAAPVVIADVDLRNAPRVPMMKP